MIISVTTSNADLIQCVQSNQHCLTSWCVLLTVVKSSIVYVYMYVCVNVNECVGCVCLGWNVDARGCKCKCSVQCVLHIVVTQDARYRGCPIIQMSLWNEPEVIWTFQHCSRKICFPYLIELWKSWLMT